MEAPAVLYHYASLDTLALILHNRTIRFSRLDKVDDPQPTRTAFSGLSKSWKNEARQLLDLF